MPLGWGDRDERARFCPQSHGGEKRGKQQLQNSVLATVLEVCTGAAGAPRKDCGLHVWVGGWEALQWILSKGIPQLATPGMAPNTAGAVGADVLVYI